MGDASALWFMIATITFTVGLYLGAKFLHLDEIEQEPRTFEPEEVVQGLNDMRVVTGLSRTEKELLEYAANYISKKEGLN